LSTYIRITEEVLDVLSLATSKSFISKLLLFEKTFFKWNAIHNLSSLKTLDEFYFDHVFDSLVLATYIKKSKVNEAFDLGSGNGFPGLVLAMLLDENNFTLIDSSFKKTLFLKYCLKVLKLNNVKILNTHFDHFEYPNNKFKVFSRALGLYKEQLRYFSKTNVDKIYFMSTKEIYNKIKNNLLEKTRFKNIVFEDFFYKKLIKIKAEYKKKGIIIVT
jgi:16S rRNA (guanine527-N7)-methyltransferase